MCSMRSPECANVSRGPIALLRVSVDVEPLGAFDGAHAANGALDERVDRYRWWWRRWSCRWCRWRWSQRQRWWRWRRRDPRVVVHAARIEALSASVAHVGRPARAWCCAARVARAVVAVAAAAPGTARGTGHAVGVEGRGGAPLVSEATPRAPCPSMAVAARELIARYSRRRGGWRRHRVPPKTTSSAKCNCPKGLSRTFS